MITMSRKRQSLGVLVPPALFLGVLLFPLGSAALLYRRNLLVVFSGDWLPPLARSACFAAGTTLLNMIAGFWCAVALRHVRGRVEIALTVLILPALIGNVATSFIIKLLIIQSPVTGGLIADRAPIPTFVLKCGCRARTGMVGARRYLTVP